MDRRPHVPLKQALDALHREFADLGYPEDILIRAEGATARAIGSGGEGVVAAPRARAYFLAVARREIARSRKSSPACARLIADSVVEDLLSAGRSRRDALEELERGWSGSLPHEILQEYRERMCA